MEEVVRVTLAAVAALAMVVTGSFLLLDGRVVAGAPLVLLGFVTMMVSMFVSGIDPSED